MWKMFEQTGRRLPMPTDVDRNCGERRLRTSLQRLRFAEANQPSELGDAEPNSVKKRPEGAAFFVLGADVQLRLCR
jgi:hypothetical protein